MYMYMFMHVHVHVYVYAYVFVLVYFMCIGRVHQVHHGFATKNCECGVCVLWCVCVYA